MVKLSKTQLEKLIEFNAIHSFDTLNYADGDCVLSFQFWENDLMEGSGLLEQLFYSEHVAYLESIGITDELLYEMYQSNDYVATSEISNDKFCPSCIFEIPFEYLGDIDLEMEGIEISGFYAPNQLLLF